MPSATDDQRLLAGQVTFIQHHLPGLEAGAYQLHVSQQVADAAGKALSDDSLTNTYTFAVRNDRFRLSDPAVVFGLFPADQASGNYQRALPHVVFSKRTFPWLRQPGAGEVPPAPAPGTDTDRDVPTWLAVLLLDEDDAAGWPGLELQPQPATLRDLFPPQLRRGSTLAPTDASYFSRLPAAALPDTDATGLEWGEQLDDAIQVLDLPLPLFWQLAPAAADLPYLAHARQVSLRPKATIKGISDVGQPLGDFSLVVGNRLPQPGRKATAYLVSLEGLQELLPDANGQPLATGAALINSHIRLAVLKSWTFFATDEAASFAARALALNGRAPADAAADAPLTTLRLPYAGSHALVQRALQLGYAPLNQTLRTGETTVSWYRGPLVPQPVPAQRLRVPVASPDQATRFDPTTGMLDVSYAAAWTLGRLLALQDKSFSVALYNWKLSLTTKTVKAVEVGLLSRQLSPLLTAAAPPAETAARAARSAPPATASADASQVRTSFIHALLNARPQ